MDNAATTHASHDTPLPGTEYALVRAHGYAALATLLISATFGILVSLKFNFPDFLGGEGWLTWGRLRYNHTQGVFFGWLGNAFLAFLYYSVPRLADRPVLSRKLGWLLFVLWNFAVVLPGWVLVLAGFSQPLEWAEFPLIVDLFVVLALLLMTAQFVLPIMRRGFSQLYVSGWYIIGGIIFTLLAYPVGNLVPQLIAGARGAAFSGLWIHDAVGLYITPFAVAISYFVIPAVTRRPLYSHFLSMLGFWLLFFFYPLNGTHHYLFSSLPMATQQSAIIASVFLGMDVILVVTNQLLSLRGSSNLVGRDIPLRFIWTGIIFYVVVSLQGSLQALAPLNRLTHFSDWVIGHSHLAMLGFATFTAAGGLAHIWQRMPGVRFNARAMAWSYWLLLSGLLLMVADLTLAGLVEAHLWQTSLPWLDSVRAARGYWIVRSLTAIPITAGFILFWIGMVSGPKGNERVSHTEENAATRAVITASERQLHTAPSSAWNMAYLSAFVAGVGFFALSFLVLGIIPGKAMEQEIARTAPITMQTLTASEQHGREIYGREGCAYCHTQQVRFVNQDVARFGAPTKVWETQYDYPQLWGTRRIGPDLQREAGIRSDDWQLAHLYNPRLTVKDSVMPGYSWLFAGSATQPGQPALDLLAYLKTLGRARTVSGYDQTSHGVPLYCNCADDIKQLEREQLPLNASASMARRAGIAPLFTPSADPVEFASDIRRGMSVYAENCASCHGTTGAGNGPAAQSLMPRPANLNSGQYSVPLLSAALWNGVAGTAMPAWRDLPLADLRGLVAYVGRLHVPEKVEPTATVSLVDVKQIYAQNCVSCHGVNGAGNGPAAGAQARVPTNFQLKRPDAGYAAQVLEHGVPGTSMPSWKDQLSIVQRDALVNYVRSLYASEPQASR